MKIILRRMISLGFGNLMPDSYVSSVYDINYYKLQENGIKYAVFDVDCTIVPFDSSKVDDELNTLFRYIKFLGIKPALFSSNLDSKVKPIANSLGVNYAPLRVKPFASFDEVKALFDSECNEENTVYIGDSFFFDMLQADNLHVYKILVDMIRNGSNLKLYANDIIQMVMSNTIVSSEFEFGKHYRGHLER